MNVSEGSEKSGIYTKEFGRGISQSVLLATEKKDEAGIHCADRPADTERHQKSYGKINNGIKNLQSKGG